MEVGLLSWRGGFLTGERFGEGEVSALGSSLGPRQRWRLEVAEETEAEEESRPWTEVSLWGPGGRRLVAEADGAVRCCAGPGEESRGQFLLEVHPSGAWSLRQKEDGGRGSGGRYLESDGEDVFCVSRRLRGPPQLWMPHLAAHPHAALFHPRRRRFAREDPDLGRVWVDARSPDQPHCAFLFLRRRLVLQGPDSGGGEGSWCHVETAGHRFLGGGGERLAPGPSAETALQLSLRPGGRLCLADRRGRLLYPQGPRGLLRPGDDPHDGEEWFLLRRCPPSVSLAACDGRFLAVLRDGQVYAAGSKKAAAPPSASSFLLEFCPDGRTLQLKGPRRKYLAQRALGTVMADGRVQEPETRFQPLWLDGKVFLRAPDGRFLGTAAPLGLLVARAPRPGPSEEFALRLANRSFLVLRGRDGFVGSSSGSGAWSEGLLRGDRLEPDCVELLPCERGIYHLRSRGKGFWALTPERRLHPWGKVALNFCLELRGRNLLALRGPNGRFLRGDREGPLVADREEACRECLWEF